jgi:hypothetical protein
MTTAVADPACRRSAHLHWGFFAAGGSSRAGSSSGSNGRGGDTASTRKAPAGKLGVLELSQDLATSLWAVSMVRWV